MSTKTVILLILALIILATLYFIKTNKTDTTALPEETTVRVKEGVALPFSPEVIEDTQIVFPEEEVAQDQATTDPLAKGVYTNYSEAAAKLAATNGSAVLFFHAAWCPTCRGLDATLSSEEIPAGLQIFKADYDAETKLKRQYAITSQHTLVLVDENLTLIKKWRGSQNVADITRQLP